MQKKLLITVSEEISHLHGVRFVGSFFRNKSQVHVTLYYVVPHAYVVGQRASSGERAFDKKAGEVYRAKGEAVLETARQMLCDRGFPPQNITPKFISRQFGTVKDIIREAKQGLYDAIVLGRRGYTMFESVFSTSVTKEILDRDLDIPIWVCRHPEEGRGNVLLCIDGSGACLRMVDHVGFMLGDENEHSLTLLYVDAEEGGNKETIMAEARTKLLENGVPDERVSCLVVTSSITGVARAIAEEAEFKGYAAIGVGRVGTRKGRLKELLIGSRTMKLLESIEKASLWVSS